MAEIRTGFVVGSLVYRTGISLNTKLLHTSAHRILDTCWISFRWSFDLVLFCTPLIHWIPELILHSRKHFWSNCNGFNLRGPSSLGTGKETLVKISAVFLPCREQYRPFHIKIHLLIWSQDGCSGLIIKDNAWMSLIFSFGKSKPLLILSTERMARL